MKHVLLVPRGQWTTLSVEYKGNELSVSWFRKIEIEINSACEEG